MPQFFVGAPKFRQFLSYCRAHHCLLRRSDWMSVAPPGNLHGGRRLLSDPGSKCERVHLAFCLLPDRLSGKTMTALLLGAGALLLAPAEAQHLVATGVQQGAWAVNGYGIAPAAERASLTAPASTEPSGQKCYYVLDVLLCD